MKVFCITAVRDEERYLPGFLHHLRDHVDGVVALDDGSCDRTVEILRRDRRVLSVLHAVGGAPHERESVNRHRLLTEAARLGARWVVCLDADERLDTASLPRLRDEARNGDRTGRPIRLLQLVNLWNAPDLWRADGPCGPRWAPRMFGIPATFTQRSPALHQPWFPPELDDAPRAHMDAILYHLRMIDRRDREARYEKFRSIDPDNRHQAVGYAHLVDETGLDLKPVRRERSYMDLTPDGTPVEVFRALADMPPPAAMPAQDAFDEAFYLNENLDVRRALTSGAVASGWAHFERQGAREGRPWRKKAALAGLDFAAILAARGLDATEWADPTP